jgi:hypothetical protein
MLSRFKNNDLRGLGRVHRRQPEELRENMEPGRTDAQIPGAQLSLRDQLLQCPQDHLFPLGFW